MTNYTYARDERIAICLEAGVPHADAYRIAGAVRDPLDRDPLTTHIRRHVDAALRGHGLEPEDVSYARDERVAICLEAGVPYYEAEPLARQDAQAVVTAWRSTRHDTDSQ